MVAAFSACLQRRGRIQFILGGEAERTKTCSSSDIAPSRKCKCVCCTEGIISPRLSGRGHFSTPRYCTYSSTAKVRVCVDWAPPPPLLESLRRKRKHKWDCEVKFFAAGELQLGCSRREARSARPGNFLDSNNNAMSWHTSGSVGRLLRKPVSMEAQ